LRGTSDQLTAWDSALCRIAWIFCTVAGERPLSSLSR
jgi:hypothetical protein